MKIVADENIPYAEEAFSTIGDVTLVSGRNVCSLKDTDALIVRSITNVNEKLLAGSSVQFVGTSTIGYDHIDQEYLRERKIGFASAPGSNSNSVAEYITAALLNYASERSIELRGRSIGVVGVGNVGSKVVEKCESIGMTVLKNDPPLQEKTMNPSFLPLDEVICADFVTLHVPLTKTGKYPTYHLAGKDFIGAMNGVLLNTSRGSVVDETALSGALGNSVETAMLDVWEHEPNINTDLAGRINGTPHIAGYSFDGKVNGTQMMYDAVCNYFGIEPVWIAADSMPPGKDIACSGLTDEDVLRNAVFQVYDICKDFVVFHEHMTEFDRLRKEYPIRREFPTTSVTMKGNDGVKEKLCGLGFKVK